MKIEKTYPETLRQLMIEVLATSSKFSYREGMQPFLMSFDGKEYYVYVKNLSSAYFTDRPDTTRAQLPIRDEFEEIKKSHIPFIFLGYDQNNDVLVCWNFHIVKTRLNEKKSVSFYSRRFFQEEVTQGIFLRKRLKNDDEPVLFKRVDLVSFFNQIDTFFPLNKNTNDTHEVVNETEPIEENKLFVSNGKLLKITDSALIEQLKPLIEQKRTLQAWQHAADFYKGQFPAMKLTDWKILVKEIDFEESVSEANDNDEQIEITHKVYSIDNVRSRFINYMQDTNLSEKSISNYVHALSGRISEGIRKYLNPDLDDIFKITDISLLNLWLPKLFNNQEYMILDEIGKKMYSCALKKYIQFVEFLSEKETYIVAEPQIQYITTHEQENFSGSEKRKLHILKVTYPDGRVVSERIVYKTLIDVIQSVGASRVQELGIFVNKINIVSDTVLPLYEKAQKSIGNGLYVMTNCDTDTKQRIIEQISEAFDMGLKIEKIEIL
ncbi:MAG: hypothetical protein LBV41_01115 [Cytophagaceae bacterium]|jgi:hypothetical protein|nr:hypothetical protein [Cytophagaceae bacterium]